MTFSTHSASFILMDRTLSVLLHNFSTLAALSSPYVQNPSLASSSSFCPHRFFSYLWVDILPCLFLHFLPTRFLFIIMGRTHATTLLSFSAHTASFPPYGKNSYHKASRFFCPYGFISPLRIETMSQSFSLFLPI